MSQAPLNTNSNSLVDQLNAATTDMSNALQAEEPAQDLEQFIIERSKTLISQSLDAVAGFKIALTQAPNSQDAEALAGLITATANALDVVNRLVLTDKKVTGAKDIKKMEIDARNEYLETNSNRSQRQLTREDVMKLLSDGNTISPVISAEIIDVTICPDYK